MGKMSRARKIPVYRAGKRPLAISGLAVWWYSLLCTPPGSLPGLPIDLYRAADGCQLTIEN